MFRHLHNAFSTGSPFSPPSEEQLQLVDRLAGEIVRRRLTTPALATLEMSRPLNFIGAQAMHFFAPVVNTMFDAGTYEKFAKFLERRDAIDVLMERIEYHNAVASQQTTEEDSAPSASNENA